VDQDTERHHSDHGHDLNQVGEIHTLRHFKPGDCCTRSQRPDLLVTWFL
jgi:hypothetical protein